MSGGSNHSLYTDSQDDYWTAKDGTGISASVITSWPLWFDQVPGALELLGLAIKPKPETNVWFHFKDIKSLFHFKGGN